MAAGGQYNLTIPSANCTSAELQYSDGSSRKLSLPAPCSGGLSNFTLGLSDKTPTGLMKLTVICPYTAPSCYTFLIQSATSESVAGQIDELHDLCPSTNPSYPTIASALPLGGASGSAAVHYSVAPQPPSRMNSSAHSQSSAGSSPDQPTQLSAQAGSQVSPPSSQPNASQLSDGSILKPAAMPPSSNREDLGSSVSAPETTRTCSCPCTSISTNM